MVQLGDTLMKKIGIKFVRKCCASTWDLMRRTRTVWILTGLDKKYVILQLGTWYVIPHSQVEHPVVPVLFLLDLHCPLLHCRTPNVSNISNMHWVIKSSQINHYWYPIYVNIIILLLCLGNYTIWEELLKNGPPYCYKFIFIKLQTYK
jgi:hypothetical protein